MVHNCPGRGSRASAYGPMAGASPVFSGLQTAWRGMCPGSEGHGLQGGVPSSAPAATGRCSVVARGVVAGCAPAPTGLRAPPFVGQRVGGRVTGHVLRRHVPRSPVLGCWGGIPRALLLGAASPAWWLWVLGGGGPGNSFAVQGWHFRALPVRLGVQGVRRVIGSRVR